MTSAIFFEGFRDTRDGGRLSGRWLRKYNIPVCRHQNSFWFDDGIHPAIAVLPVWRPPMISSVVRGRWDPRVCVCRIDGFDTCLKRFFYWLTEDYTGLFFPVAFAIILPDRAFTVDRFAQGIDYGRTYHRPA